MIVTAFAYFFSAIGFTHNRVYSQDRANTYRIVFYNTENFFDTSPDSVTGFNDFTPEGVYHWTSYRYAEKQNHLYKVIAAAGGWENPAIVAMAEIENEKVLNDLLKNTPLGNEPFSIVHFESGDHRGIDCALIYDSLQLKLLKAAPVRYLPYKGENLATRDILYAKFKIADDTIHFFVNHWPSRYGGALETEFYRELAARSLQRVTDSVCRADKNALVVAVGDFNDPPEAKSIGLITTDDSDCKLLGLNEIPDGEQVNGTHRYRENWEIFDQVLTSEPLLNNKGSLQVDNGTAFIFSPKFLLENDEKYLGVKPNRTYLGYKYHGGFSDHLPVYIDLVAEKE